MSLPDLTKYDDQKLSELLNAAVAERNRRESLASIPAQIAELRISYTDGGGTNAALDEAVQMALLQPPITDEPAEEEPVEDAEPDEVPDQEPSES